MLILSLLISIVFANCRVDLDLCTDDQVYCDGTYTVGCQDADEWCLNKGYDTYFGSDTLCDTLETDECAMVFNCLDTGNLCFWNGTASQCEYQGTVISQECLSLPNEPVSVNGTFNMVLYANETCTESELPNSRDLDVPTTNATDLPTTNTSASVPTSDVSTVPSPVSRDVEVVNTHQVCVGYSGCVVQRDLVIREQYICQNVRSIEVPVFFYRDCLC